MSGILDALKKADALILASPVYFFGVSAQLKLAVDRIYALLRGQMRIQRAAMLLTCGNPDGGVADGAVSMLKRMCGFNDWENAGVILAAGMRGENPMEGRDELEQARRLGQEI
jgi:multimeric flavodoxin WrbA